MRYRPLGRDGRSISAVTLVVDEEPRREADRTRLVYAALESGVNAFELRGDRLVETASGLARALSAVPREAVVISLRLGPDTRPGLRPFSRDWVIHAVERTLYAAGLDKLDLLTFDLPDAAAFDHGARQAAEAARDAGRIGLVGAAGAPAALDAALAAPELDVLVTPYNLRSEWPERNRLKAAAARGLVVIGAQSYPQAVEPEPEGALAVVGRGLFGLGRKTPPLEKATGYGFLERTPGWTPQELCLAYALTEPALASVLVEARDPKALQGLAETAERDLPTGVPAQIEMARFSTL